MARLSASTARSARGKPAANGAGTKRTRRERVADKEDAIVAAAYDIILAKGLARTTIAEIARRAGVAEGTVYLYFENKDALGQAVLAAFYARLTARAAAGVKKHAGVRAKLRFLARHHLESIMRESAILEMIAITDRNSEAYEGSALYRMNKDYVAVFDAVFRDGVLAGDIAKDKPLWIMRDVFFGGLEYAMRTIMVRGRKKNVDDAVAGIVDLIIPASAPAAAENDLARLTGRLETVAMKLESVAANKRAVRS